MKVEFESQLSESPTIEVLPELIHGLGENVGCLTRILLNVTSIKYKTQLLNVFKRIKWL